MIDVVATGELVVMTTEGVTTARFESPTDDEAPVTMMLNMTDNTIPGGIKSYHGAKLQIVLTYDE